MQDPVFVHQAFSAIASRYVRANHLLSLGVDVMWRQRVLDLVAEWKPARLLDVATGTGDLALTIQRALPEVEVLGTDFCRPMLDVAVERGLKRVLEADALNLPLEDDSFDVLTVAFGLRNMADYGAALREFARVLRPGGRLLILDFSLPRQRFLAQTYRFYLHRILPRAAGLITGESAAYSYLGQSIETFPQGEAMCELIESCGYELACAKELSAGIASIYTARLPELD